MFRYPTYPNLWIPTDQSAILIVKVPALIHQLDWPRYQTLMEERLTWMIWRQMQETGWENTLQQLTQFLNETAPSQFPPEIDDPSDLDEIAMACQDWAQTLVHGNEIVREAIALADFSVQPITPANSTYSDMLDLHNDTSLSTWLTEV